MSKKTWTKKFMQNHNDKQYYCWVSANKLFKCKIELVESKLFSPSGKKNDIVIRNEYKLVPYGDKIEKTGSHFLSSICDDDDDDDDNADYLYYGCKLKSGPITYYDMARKLNHDDRIFKIRRYVPK